MMQTEGHNFGMIVADVSVEKAQARVEFEDSKITPDKLVAAIDRLGFKAKLLGVEPGA